MAEFYCDKKESQKLYKIGMFSQMNRVTVKALRYYDELGLLKPEYVEQENGYRYYTSAQLPQLHRILALREMDFTLEEIQQIFNGADEEKLLQSKKGDLLKMIANLSSKIACIEGYLAKGCYNQDYRIVMKSLPQVIIASMRVHLASYESLFSCMPDMGLEMEKAGCECAEPDYCFTTYYDEEYKESDIDAEICQAVTEKKQDTEKLKFTELPEVELAACVLHKGPYHQLPLAYSAIVSFIEESGYEIVGHQREYYIDGMWNKDSDQDWLTEIQFPVRKIKKEISF